MTAGAQGGATPGRQRRPVVVTALVLGLLLAGGCGSSEVDRPGRAADAGEASSAGSAAETVGGSGASDEPAAEREAGPRRLWFVDATEEAGLAGFLQVNGAGEKSEIVQAVGAGCAFLDHDGDGDLDVYLTNGSSLDGFPAGAEPRDALYENVGGGRFRDVTEAAGLGDTRWTNGVTVADHDGDGHPDIYLSNFGPNRLLRNRGDGTFEDVTEAAGVGDPRWSTSAAFFDADGDRDLDLYVANYVEYQRGFVPADESGCTYRDIMVFYGPKGLVPAGDRLYRNDGGTFVDVTEEAGIENLGGYGFQVLTFDSDDDGDLDVFVANDSTPNYLWRNRGDGTFEEMGLLSGLALSETGMEQGSMGAALGDVDSDGRLDLYVTNFSEDYYTLYRNEGGGFFADVTFRLDLGEATYPSLGWGCHLFDPDNDGDVDAFASNGHVYPQVDEFAFGTSYRQANQLFEQVAPGRFREAGDGGGPGFAVRQSSRGSAVGDYDDDGDLDVLVSNLDAAPTLLRNDGEDLGQWLSVRLRGRAPNTDAIGALVTVVVGESRRAQGVVSSTSFLSRDDPRLHYGLGEAERADEIVVRWPSGRESRFEDVAGGRAWVVDEETGLIAAEER